MDASISSNSMSLILEEKVNDLESKLAHTSQALKTKEHVLHLQQDQIKKLEEMYKKCLEDVANVTCEHKKTLHDLENLRIILKSYERRKQYSDFELQVNLTPAPPHCTEEQPSSEQLGKINISLVQQNEKSDHIIELLSTATVEPLAAIRQHISELETAAESLIMVSNRHVENNQHTRILLPHEDESEQNCSASYRINDLETMSFFIENGCQTLLLQADSSTNIPLQTTATGVQAMTDHVHFGTNTTTTNSAYKSIQCQLQIYASIMTQNSLFGEIYSLKTSLHDLELEVVVNENICNHLKVSLANCEKLLGCVNEKNIEISELRETVALLSAFIERQSFLNVEQIKELCKHVIVQTGDDCMFLVKENTTLKAQNQMLLQEIETLKSGNAEIPRIVVELLNQDTQTDVRDNMEEQGDDYRQRLLDLSKELAEAYSSIKYLKCRNEALEGNAQTLKDLKDLFVTLNLETNHLYRSQLVEEKDKHDGEISLLMAKIQALEQQLLDNHNNNIKQEFEVCTSSTQIYGWAPMEEHADVLRAENNELAKRIAALKEELAAERVNQVALKELNAMCLKLGQNVNENAIVKQENVQLKQQLAELQLAQECDAIRGVQMEISKLRADNRALSDGVKQLGRIVYLNPRNIHKETDAYASSENTSSNECLCVTNYRSSDLNGEDSSTDIEELKCLCEDLSARLQCTHPCSNNMDNKLELLASLENDLQVLMKEFLDFKWSSQNEHQKLIMKHSDLLTQNEELINCLNQYKSVNESLLQSHYDLEKAKNNAASQHQNLLEEYLQLQEQVPKKISAHCGVNTVLYGGDVVDAVQLKLENIDLQKQNLKLRQEVDNLLTQVNDQHVVCLKKLQENIEQQTCKHCDNVLNTLQTLNVNFSKVNEENIQLRGALSEKNCELDEAHQKCAKLVNDIRMNAQMQEDLELNNTHLMSELKRLQSATAACDKLHTELNLLQRHRQQACEELSECLRKNKDLEQAIIKYQAEIDMLQNAIANVGSISEEHECLQQELAQLQAQLKAVNDTKSKVECDFESYIRTNNLLQQTMNTQNTSLKDELKLLKEENEKLLQELQDLQCKQKTSKTELVRVVNECANYKIQLENMAQRIDAHMKEHLDYKAEVDEVKRNLQAEIANLRKMLEMHNQCPDAFEIRNYRNGSSVENLKAFINAKEMEIDYLMGQKIQALEAMGQFANERESPKDQAMQENFRVHLNFRKAKDLSAPSQSVHPPRSASLPRIVKTTKKSFEMSARSSQTRKPALNHQAQKRKDFLHK